MTTLPPPDVRFAGIRFGWPGGPLILDGLVARGLRSVTVPELLRAGQPSIASPGDYKLSDYADASN